MNKKVLTVTLNPAIDYTIQVPDFRVDDVNRASSGRRDPGGKGINLATALSQGGLKTAVTGFLGKSNCAIFTEHFKANGLEDNFIYVDGPTREGIKVADPKNMITTDINFKGFSLTPGEINKFRTQFTGQIEGCDYVVMAGSIPEGVPETFYADLAVIAKAAGAFVAVDTSGLPLKKVIESGAVDLIKPNLDELTEIYPDELTIGDQDKALSGLIKKILKNVRMVALTMGAEGSRLYIDENVYQATAARIAVKSTVGAGDTFLAGFICGLAKEQNAEDALLTAVCWTSSKLTKFGPGLSKEQPPEVFADKIIISSVL